MAARKKDNPIRKTTKGKMAKYNKTNAGAGMQVRGVADDRTAKPVRNRVTPVTGSPAKGSKDAKSRTSCCARSAGKLNKFPKAAKAPNSRLRQARKRWTC